MTEEWKALVRRRLAELGKDHRWLQEQIGAGSAMISKMLRPGAQSSKLVDAVCRVLEIPPPVAILQGDDERELIDLFRKVSARGKRHVLSTLEMLADGDKDEPD